MLGFRLLTLGDNDYAYINGCKPRPIYEDGIRGKWFYIPNIDALKDLNFIMQNPECNFRGRISQAIQAVINGYGDEIQEFADGDVKVIFYLNRDKGETKRHQTLEKYQDKLDKIKYQIVYWKGDCSISACYQYEEYIHPVTWAKRVNFNRFQTYDTKKEAEHAAKEIYQAIRIDAKKIIDKKHVNEPIGRLLEVTYNNTLTNDTDYYMGQKIYENIFWDMFDPDLTGSYMYTKNDPFECLKVWETIVLK